MARKLRKLELRAGLPARRGQRGSSYEYNLPEYRQADRACPEQGAAEYRHLVNGWRDHGPNSSKENSVMD